MKRSRTFALCLWGTLVALPANAHPLDDDAAALGRYAERSMSAGEIAAYKIDPASAAAAYPTPPEVPASFLYVVIPSNATERAKEIAAAYCHDFPQPLLLPWRVRVLLRNGTLGAECAFEPARSN